MPSARAALSPLHNPNLSHATDGKGIDHAFAAYGEQIFGSYAICGVEF